MKYVRLTFKIIAWLVIIGTIVLAVYLYQKGYLTDVKKLRTAMHRYGAWSPLIFVLLQIIQVAIPVLPGGVSTLAGVVIFGPFWGFIWNYIGICIGSVLGFHIAKRFGRPALETFFSPKLLESYEHRTNSNSKFAKYFAWAIFLPIAPDDLLCYLAGTTSMSYKQFTLIIVLGKPASILAYSLGLTTILSKLLGIG
ncbi:TVP38/TMEM64 family protein [Streptococcus macacae]|uniref:TVP38/TMEM64 family membrane protein n=1 Tax=Streptococcus macacae NCTC 11558 TaxID=764298 RepID=G5JZA2_9STRE|nr:SNARE-like domain protein [Streptococcus macacae NCTC 11558]